MKQKSLKKNAVLNIIRSTMSLIFPLITFPYSSRILLPEGIGKVNFATSIISYFSIIAALGISAYGIRTVATLRNDRIALSKAVKEIFTINLISTILAYFLLSLSIIFVPKFVEYRTLLIICSSSILFTTIGMDYLYCGLEEYSYITLRSIIFQVISIALLFLLVHTKEDYLKYASIAVISSCGSNIMNFIHARKFITFRYKTKLNLHQHIKPTLTFFAMVVTTSIYTALDTSMLGFLSGEFSVGIYSAATKINKMVLMLVTSVGAVLLPRLSYYANTDKEEFQRLVYKAFYFLFIISVPCSVGLCILGKPIIMLFSGINFIPAVPVMRIMNPIILIIGLSNLIGMQIFTPLKKEKWTLYSVIAGAITNFTLNIILIPKHGAVGAAVATLCAETVVTMIQLILVRKILSLKKIHVFFLRTVLNTIVMTLPVFCCMLFIRNNLLQVCLGVISGVITYTILLILEKNEFAMLFVNKFLKKNN